MADPVWDTANGHLLAGSSPSRWPQPLDFFADDSSVPPELRPEHVPLAIWNFATDTAGRMGVDPTSVALCCLVSCAAVMTDLWRIQPKLRDTTWTESPRIWGAIVGDPSILKTPVIAACTQPIERLDEQAREQHAQDMRGYKTALAAWKAGADKEGSGEPEHPKLSRYLVEGTTVEALSEALRDDADARQHAPARKVLSRQDEMSEFFGNLDRYTAGGRGGGDRGAYLRLYNGGRYVVDRIARGSFAVPNWSACFIGGIQPGPIQRLARESAEDGLLQRLIFCVPGLQQPGADRAPNVAAREHYEALFPALAAMCPPRQNNLTCSSVVVLHADAHQHRLETDAFARAMAMLPDSSSRLRAAFGKWPGLFGRLCLIFHLITVADARIGGGEMPYVGVVSEATARQVAGFMQDVIGPHLLRADAMMFSTVQTSHARWIAGYILSQQMERITTRDVTRAYGALRPPEAKNELAAVMESLVTVGWLEPETPSNPAKSVFSWAINPSVHVAFEARAQREQDLRAKTRESVAADLEVLRRKRSEPRQ